MSISEPFIRRPIATSLVMVALALVGIVAFLLLPVAPLPQVDFPTIQVTATLAGASPETMASSVAAPLERQLGQLADVTEMTSFSALGATSITIQFDLGRNINSAAQDVQAAINAAGRTLPQTMTTPPTYRKLNPAETPILILSMRSDAFPLTVVNEYADNFLAQEISEVPGVAQVSIGGEQKRAIRIQIDPARLASRGLTLEDVRAAIAVATTNAAKGALTTPTTTFTIAANDQITEPEQFDNVIIAYRNGAPVRVRDVGRALIAAADRGAAAFPNNKPGLLLSVNKMPGANVIETVNRIKAQLPQLVANIPPAIIVETILDRTVTIRAAVYDVELTLVLTIGLVVLVVLLFLRSLWATLIPGVIVVLSLLGSFATMYVLNFSLDNISLMALTIATGFVIDDAIVVVENIYRHIEQGTPAYEAALNGSREIGFTVLSISMSLVAVFIPLLLMGGIAGRVFREFSVTFAIAVSLSALISLTFAPVMCSRLIRGSDARGFLYRTTEAALNTLASGYEKTLDIALRHRKITFCVFLLTVALTIALIIQIPKGFFPDSRYRGHQRAGGSRSGRISRRNDAASACAGRRDQRKSRYCGVRVLDRQHREQWQCSDSKYCPLLYRFEVARRTQALSISDYQSTAARDRRNPRREAVLISRSGHHRGRAVFTRRFPIHPAWHQHRGSGLLVGKIARNNANTARDF